MTAVAFDTYRIVKRLRDAGFTESQAEAVTTAIQDSTAVDLSGLVTKEHFDAGKEHFDARLVATEQKFEARLAATEQKFEARFAINEQKIDARFEKQEQLIELVRRDVTIRFGGMLVVAVGVILTAFKLMAH